MWAGWYRLHPPQPQNEPDGKAAAKLLWHVVANCQTSQTYVRSHADYDSVGRLVNSEDFSAAAPAWTDPIPDSNGDQMLKGLCEFADEMVKAGKARR